MGCDIHFGIERKIGDKWVMVQRDGGSAERAGMRDYQRFAALAGVRGDGPEPKGLPPDISDSVKLYVDDWGGDGHSHSWMDLEEAAKIFLSTEYGQINEWMRNYPSDYYFNISNPKDHRIVFWFDN